MRIGCRWRDVACFGAGLCVVAAAHGQAQESEHGWAQTATATNRVETLGGDAEGLLGGPAPPGDLYGTAGNSARAAERVLSNTQRVPRGGLAGGGDDGNDREPQRPLQPVQRPREAQPGIAGAQPARDANKNRADPGTQSPTQSALSIYHGPGDVGKAVGQVYRMPW
ncbi:hypothetical protein AB1286_16365 [Trinickia sp. NRRL B-1857]|uniref:hypothetical protein n=1 Tax=Trinickia sp. NRRL B-1857 TaxID=3162879 RepID=UPI003D2A57B2